MNVLEEELTVDGHVLRRFVFRPDNPASIRATVMHFHGQGDFAERYGEIFAPLVAQGLACVATDLPGHGRSKGARGRVPGFAIVDHIAEANNRRCRELGRESGGPVGILGHSAGGLIALRELLLHPERYSFSWISSPLLRPEANQNPILVWLAPLGARLFPGLTLSTGVTPDQCSQRPEEARAEYDDPALFHSRVSLGWGYAMLEAAGWVRETLCSSPPGIPILLTQGLRDPVCPPEHLHAVLEKAAIPGLRLCEFPEALHEPFSDIGREQVMAEVARWLEEEVFSRNGV